jgi:hypothetical protein
MKNPVFSFSIGRQGFLKVRNLAMIHQKKKHCQGEP